MPAGVQFRFDGKQEHVIGIAGRHATVGGLLAAVAGTAAGESAFARDPMMHTYSIVARDAKTGQLGVAVQSHWFSVGPVVPWAEAGVGAVATQSLVRIDYGPLGLAAMRAGEDAKTALEKLMARDDGREVRQVAMVDSSGKVAVHTGSKCIASAGHYSGDGFSVQANLMLNDEVVPAMRAAYERATGDFADRLLATLGAAQGAGGDIRGRQSAAILIVSGERQEAPWQGRLMELRVEDHPTPVKELRRLVQLHRAYEHSNRGDELIEEIYEKLKDGPFTILGINSGDDKPALERAIKKHEITWPTIMDGTPEPGSICATWHVASFPTLYLVDRKGVIRHKDLMPFQMDGAIDALMAEAEAKN